MGLAPKQRDRLSTCKQVPRLWCLSHFHGGPPELMMVRDKVAGTVRRALLEILCLIEHGASPPYRWRCQEI